MPLTGNTAKIRVIEKIKKMITQNKKIQVLDVGCGDLILNYQKIVLVSTIQLLIIFHHYLISNLI
jgi:predicted RNase H-related nuclease YkuK (DUF458 family)